jgi:hypothetical protein
MKDRIVVSLFFLLRLSATTSAAQTQELKKPIVNVETSENIPHTVNATFYDRTSLRLRSCAPKRNTKLLLINGGAE